MSIANTLKIDKDKRFLVETNDVIDPLLKAVKKYSGRYSILRIREKLNRKVFSFRHVMYNLDNLDTLKSTQSDDIPFKINKDNTVIYDNFILENFNQCIIHGKFLTN